MIWVLLKIIIKSFYLNSSESKSSHISWTLLRIVADIQNPV